MTRPTEISKRVKDHEISVLTSLASTAVQKLRSRWIATVEQLVATAATMHGQKALESLLGESPDAIEVLLKEARELLGSVRYEALMQVKPGGPMGARFDDPAFNPGGSKGGKA